jgi:hypothetical protein
MVGLAVGKTFYPKLKDRVKSLAKRNDAALAVLRFRLAHAQFRVLARSI